MAWNVLCEGDKTGLGFTGTVNLGRVMGWSEQLGILAGRGSPSPETEIVLGQAVMPDSWQVPMATEALPKVENEGSVGPFLLPPSLPHPLWAWQRG